MRAWLLTLPLAAAALQETLEMPAFEGTPTEAMDAIRRLARDEPTRAAAMAEDHATDPLLPEALRAQFRFAQGVVHHDQELFDPAAKAFSSSRALAGPGELRLDAGYNLGTSALVFAEGRRAAFLAAMQAPPGGPAAGAEDGPEITIDDLRADYLEAKSHLLDRWRADLADLDTRANLELVQRRLRELDELERQQQEQQDDSESEESQDQEQEGDSEDSEDSEEGDESEQEGQDGADQEGEGERQEQESTDPGENATDPVQNQADPHQELPDVEPGSEEGLPAERLLTREQVMQLLDRLEQLEAEGQEIQELLKSRERIPVEKDW